MLQQSPNRATYYIYSCFYTLTLHNWVAAQINFQSSKNRVSSIIKTRLQCNMLL